MGFAPYNVNLFAEKFAGRSNKVVYNLAFMSSATDATNAAVANGLVPHVPYKTFVGSPGDVITFELRLQPAVGFVGVTTSTSIAPDATNTPLPVFAEVLGAIGYNQGDITIPLQITLPNRSEFEQLFINGGIVAFSAEATPGVVNGTLTVTNNIANSSPASFVIPLDGVPGSHKNVEVSIESNVPSGETLPGFTFQNLDATDTDADLNFINAVGNGSSQATFTFDYEIPTTGESITSTLTGTTIANTVDPSQIRTTKPTCNITFRSYLLRWYHNKFCGDYSVRWRSGY